MDIPISKIHPNPDQPRRYFDPAELEAMAATMREHGVLQAVTVYEVEREYILEDGERRWRAAQIAGLTKIPAVVLPPKPGGYDSLVRATIANIQRSRLTPSEEGHAFRRLQDERNWSVAQIAREFGVCQALVKNRLAITQLEQPIQQWIDRDRLPSDQRVVEALLAIQDSQVRLALAEKLANRKATIQVCLTACQKVAAPRPEGARTARTSVAEATDETKAGWNALSQAGKLPPWPLFEQAVVHACKKTCQLADVAEAAICKDCPMALMVARLVESAGNATPSAKAAAWPVSQAGGRHG